MKRILLVEDNPDDELLTQRALRKSGYELDISVAQDGREALDFLLGEPSPEKPAPLPNLILLDLKLPKIGGLEVLEALRNNQRTHLIPVVVLTSSREDEDIMRSYNLGANSYVRKRVNAEEFEEAMKDILTYWFEFAKLPPTS